jgi:hypothetical protein
VNERGIDVVDALSQRRQSRNGFSAQGLTSICGHEKNFSAGAQTNAGPRFSGAPRPFFSGCGSGLVVVVSAIAGSAVAVT